MSSCADFYCMCCRPPSCASATSDSSPTDDVPLCCRSASICSEALGRQPIRRHRRLLTTLIHSGTVHYAVAPCTWSNVSPPRNSCFALHLNQTGAQHETLFPSSPAERAPARMQIPCLISTEMPAQLSVEYTPDPLRSRFTAPSHLQSATSCLSPLLPQISAPDQTDSKYIGFHEGGFLQVAVSEAPSLTAIIRPLLRGGAPDTALRHLGTKHLQG
jgi:hypothetical protein